MTQKEVVLIPCACHTVAGQGSNPRVLVPPVLPIPGASDLCLPAELCGEAQCAMKIPTQGCSRNNAERKQVEWELGNLEHRPWCEIQVQHTWMSPVKAVAFVSSYFAAALSPCLLLPGRLPPASPAELCFLGHGCVPKDVTQSVP